MNISKKFVYPVLVIVGGLLAAFVVVRSRPEVQREEEVTPPPLVRVLEVRTQDVPLDVRSQGTVRPHTESTLVAQVGGRIVSVSPHFAEGGFFRRGEVLVTIDPQDYRLAVSQAQAQVAQARTRLERERAEAEIAREEWEDLGTGEPSPLTLREPQLAEARAALEAAEANLEQAELNLKRTTIEAPYAGRVRAKRADLGQFVTPGTPLAEVFGSDHAEIRLPIPKDQLAFLDVDLGESAPGPRVKLFAEIGGMPRSWDARVVRTGGEIDPQTRMLPVFARVDDPFRRLGRGADPGAPGAPVLPMGLFVEAEVEGKIAPGAVVLPRSAVRHGEEVLVVDDQDRLRFRPVEVLRAQGDTVVIGKGLADGEKVVVSQMETPVEGMVVRHVLEEPGFGIDPRRLDERLEDRL